MKIVHVITGLGNGGAEALLYSLVKNDAGNSHAVVSLTDPGRYGPELEAVGVEVHCLHMGRLPLAPDGYLRLFRILRTIAPDLVQCWMYHANLIGGWVARFAGIPVIWTIHQAHTDIGRNGLRNALVVRVGALFSYLIPGRVSYCSDFARAEHLRAGYARRNAVVIRNGVDVERFRLIADKERAAIRGEVFGLDAEVPVIGMVARYTHEKDCPTLFAALGECHRRGRQFAVVLAGNGMDCSNPELVALVEQAGLRDRVRMLGPRSDVQRIMAALDLHVLSSSVEGFGNVVAEAMACGTPGVGTRTGAVAEMIDTTGWLVPVSSPGELAAAIMAALDELESAPGAWQERRVRCRERIQAEFAIGNAISAFHSCWIASARAGVPARE
jgi:glycosyltransferase involved in cell wall biosynthesis